MINKVLVSIPTLDMAAQIPQGGPLVGLDGPKRLDHTLKMLNNTCYSKDNFDIQVIINLYQEDVYKEVLDRWEIKPTIIEYQEGSWLNILQAQHIEMKKGYYFFTIFPDDLTGLSRDWDQSIMNKKDTFKDDLFSLYTTYERWGRDKEKLKNCYDSIDMANNSFEQLPIWTYKFGEFFYHLYEGSNPLPNGRELLIAVLLHLLNQRGHNRHVACKMGYEEIVCQVNMGMKQFGEYLKFTQLPRSGDPTPELREIVDKMVEYIDEMEK